MKTIPAFLLTLLFCTATVFAQIPRTISYQGILTDASGTLIPDGSHTLVLNMYTDATGGSPIFTETQPTVVVRGTFNIIIGSVSALPTSLAFDRAYFLGVSVDGGSEMSPRTPMTAVPYALRSAVADKAMSLDAAATGVVTSVNSAEGAITLQGGGGTTINRSGNTITISSSGGGGGTGIQGVQNTDGTLTIDNGNGPTATVNITNNGITNGKMASNAIAGINIIDGVVNTNKITDGAVTAVKMSSGTATNGHVLTANGSGGVVWQPSAAGFALPYSGTANVSGAGSFLANNTSGSASSYGVHGILNNTSGGSFSAGIRGENKSTSGNGIGVYGSQDGSGWGVYGVTPTGRGVYGDATGNGTGVYGSSTTGRAGDFNISATGNTSNALRGTTAGTGSAGEFTITNASSTAPALIGKTASTNVAATGVYGELTSSPASGSNNCSGVRGVVNGSNSLGSGVWGIHNAGGNGVAGTADNTGGTGVYARGDAFGTRTNSPAGIALDATTTTGFAGKFASSGTANTNPALVVTSANNNASAATFTRGNGAALTGMSGAAVFGDGDLYGVVGMGAGASSYAGVYGLGATNTKGVFGKSFTGIGVYGETDAVGTGSVGIYATVNSASNGGTALELNNGYIKVSGTNKTAFTHTTSAGNTANHITNLSYPGMASTDMLIVTHLYSASHLPRIPYSVWWDGTQWTIYLDRGVGGTETMPIGEKFNVLVIKQ